MTKIDFRSGSKRPRSLGYILRKTMSSIEFSVKTSHITCFWLSCSFFLEKLKKLYPKYKNHSTTYYSQINRELIFTLSFSLSTFSFVFKQKRKHTLSILKKKKKKGSVNFYFQ